MNVESLRRLGYESLIMEPHRHTVRSLNFRVPAVRVEGLKFRAKVWLGFRAYSLGPTVQDKT